MLLCNVILPLNINPILQTKSQISQRKGPSFNNKSHVLRILSVHLKFIENLACAEHCPQHEDLMT